MATLNPFDLLGDDAEDPLQLIVAEQAKVVAPAAPKKAAAKPVQLNKPAAQLPTKPPPPSQAGEIFSLGFYFIEEVCVLFALK